MGCATIVKEAIWLEENGADVIIAQGADAGGHRGMFLTDDVAGQPGTFALVPQVVDAVRVPVVAAGGIADGRGSRRPSRSGPRVCKSAAPICVVRNRKFRRRRGSRWPRRTTTPP